VAKAREVVTTFGKFAKALRRIGHRAIVPWSVFLALFAGITGASAQPSAPHSAAPNAQQVARRVQTFHDKTVTFEAGFEQSYVIPAHAKKKTTRGKVIFAKPGKMSFRYQGNANRVVADGRSVKV
jgi:outer membrane lipoprotein-sorting protein